MHVEFNLLQDIVIIFALASLVIWLFHKLKVPSIIGFLLTGILTGPHAFGLVQGVDEIEILAEIGVVLLLFTIGIEFSLKNLIRSRRMVFIGGALQVFLTTAITFLISYFFGRGISQAVFFGFLVALSSTAVVMKVLQERAEVNNEYGRFSVGVLIFQDIIIVPMILLIPLLAGSSANIGQDIGMLIVKVAGVSVLTYLSAQYFVPWMLHKVARTKSQELFLLSVLMFGLAVAWLTSTIGLSLALGAFLAGLTISESDYSHQAFGNVIPLRDIFISFFFVSIGMLFDIKFVLSNIGLVLVATAVVLLVKTLISGMAAFILGFSFRTTVLAGLALSQVGEFSFVLARIGANYELINNDFYGVFIAVSVLTMSLAPFIIMAAPKLADLILKLPIPEKLRYGLNPPQFDKIEPVSEHLVIIGMGLHGNNVAKAANSTGIAYIILDNDPDIVNQLKEKGERIYFGDATHESVLKQANIELAEAIVITPSGSATAYNITELARKMNPKAYIIVRARFIQDVQDLYELGASEVIPEEFETSIEIFSRVMAKYLVPRSDIEKLVAEVRAGRYEMFRSIDFKNSRFSDLKVQFPELEVAALRVHERSNVTGQSIAEMHLRNNFGITLIAVKQGEETIINPPSSLIIREEDIVYVMGNPYQITCAVSLFEEARNPECDEK